MKIAKIIIAAVVFAVIAQTIATVEAFLAMDFYTDPAYFPVWSKIMMLGAGPPPSEFFYYSISFSFINGLIFVYVFTLVKGLHKSAPYWMAGKKYGFFVWLLAGVPFSLTLYLLVNLPVMLLIYWAISSLITYVLAGIATSRIFK